MKLILENKMGGRTTIYRTTIFRMDLESSHLSIKVLVHKFTLPFSPTYVKAQNMWNSTLMFSVHVLGVVCGHKVNCMYLV